MEEMNRTHKEPVWGWVAVVADVIAWARRPRPKVSIKSSAKAPTHTPVGGPSRNGVVTPWSVNAPAGWSA
jgi:hypothetical protein